MKLFTLRIITPEKLILEEPVIQATLPVVLGEVTLLADHIPFIGSLKNGGELFIKTENDEKMLAVSGGFVEFHNNVLTILADSADRAEDIDLAEAEEAKMRAEQLKKDSENLNSDSDEYKALMAMIDRQSYRVQVARKHHSRRSGMNTSL